MALPTAPPTTTAPVFRPAGAQALLVEFASAVDDTAHGAVLALDRALAANPIAGQREVVPALINLLVVFDPSQTCHAHVEAALRAALLTAEKAQTPSRLHSVQVCYDAPFCPDLDAVAQAKGLSPEAVIAAHLSGDYKVLMYGFAPGYAYLNGVPPALHMDRKPSPVRGVAAGTVIIAAAQCLITTLTMPTGWWRIGQAATRILTDDPARPFLVDVGDQIRFCRIDRATFEKARQFGERDAP